MFFFLYIGYNEIILFYSLFNHQTLKGHLKCKSINKVALLLTQRFMKFYLSL